MATSTYQEAQIAGQTWNAARYAGNASFVPTLGAPVAELLNAQPGEHILDLGCGDGVLTAQIAATGANVVGVDASPDLVAAAVARGVDARVMDGQALHLDEVFDAVFSNAALHWMRQPEAVLSGVRNVLKPGGRFVGEFGGKGNVAAIVTALRASLRANGSPEPSFSWFFPTASEYAALLQQYGFQVEHISLIPRPTPLPTGMAGWLSTFADPFLADVPAPMRQRILDDAQALLQPALCDCSGQWHADYVRLRFVARASHTSNFKQGNSQ